MKIQGPRLETALFNVLVSLGAAGMALPIMGLLIPLLSLPSLSDGLTVDALGLGRRPLVLLGHSIVFSALVAAVTVTIGTGFVIALQRAPLGRTALTFLLPPLIVVPPAIHGINWTTAMMAAGEWMRRHELTGLLSGGWFAAGLAEVLSFLPIGIATAWAGFAMLDIRLLEAGLVYRPGGAVLWRIATRLAMPFLMSGIGVVFLLSLSEYAVPSLFSVHVFALEIFSTYSTGVHPAVTVLSATPLVFVSIAVLMTVLRVGRHAASMTRAPRGFVHPVGDRTSVSNLGTTVLLSYLAVPLTSMVATMGTPRSLLLAASSARGELIVTIAIAACAAGLCLILGSSVGRSLERKGVVSTALWTLTCLAIALPAPLVGIGIISLRAFGALSEDLLPVWAATARFLPIAAFVSFAMRRRVDHGLIEAGSVFTHSRLHALRHVTAPLMLPALLVSGALCFAFSLGELGATLLVASPGRATVMMRLYNLLHYGASQEAAALCLIVTLPPLATGLLVAVLLRPNINTTRERDPAHA